MFGMKKHAGVDIQKWEMKGVVRGRLSTSCKVHTHGANASTTKGWGKTAIKSEAGEIGAKNVVPCCNDK